MEMVKVEESHHRFLVFGRVGVVKLITNIIFITLVFRVIEQEDDDSPILTVSVFLVFS